MIDSTNRALNAIERVPEHELRRLLKRMAVTDPLAVLHGIDMMNAFDYAKSRL
jgi:hypothetical protein